MAIAPAAAAPIANDPRAIEPAAAVPTAATFAPKDLILRSSTSLPSNLFTLYLLFIFCFLSS